MRIQEHLEASQRALIIAIGRGERRSDEAMVARDESDAAIKAFDEMEGSNPALGSMVYLVDAQASQWHFASSFEPKETLEYAVGFSRDPERVKWLAPRMVRAAASSSGIIPLIIHRQTLATQR